MLKKLLNWISSAVFFVRIENKSRGKGINDNDRYLTQKYISGKKLIFIMFIKTKKRNILIIYVKSVQKDRENYKL